jgi:hypothetical protein
VAALALRLAALLQLHQRLRRGRSLAPRRLLSLLLRRLLSLLLRRLRQSPRRTLPARRE